MCQGIMYTEKKKPTNMQTKVNTNMIRSIGTKTKLLKMSLEVKKQKAKTKNNRDKYHHTCLSANIFFARRNPPARPCFAPYHPPFPCTTPVAGCTIDDARQQLSSHHHQHHLIAILSSIILIRSSSLSLSSDPFYRRLLLVRVAPAICCEFVREKGCSCV